MIKGGPIRVKYVFVDVVAFSRSRSVEAQTEIVSILNSIVRECIEDTELTPKQRIYLPTGDGICIALFDEGKQYDMHLQIALKMLEGIDIQNRGTEEKSRRFEVRVGLNENVDNLIVDINNARNVAGAGINLAQKVMNAGDKGNLMAGQVVYETLSCRDRYMKSFKSHMVRVKHDVEIPVYQFIEKGHPGLSIKTPIELRKKRTAKVKLTLEEAYYVAHAIKNRDFLLAERKSSQHPYNATVLLWFLALDSMERAMASESEELTIRISSDNLHEVLTLYDNTEFWLMCRLAVFVMRKLSNVQRLMEDSHSLFFVATDKARARLKEDYPEVYSEFELTD